MHTATPFQAHSIHKPSPTGSPSESRGQSVNNIPKQVEQFHCVSINVSYMSPPLQRMTQDASIQAHEPGKTPCLMVRTDVLKPHSHQFSQNTGQSKPVVWCRSWPGFQNLNYRECSFGKRLSLLAVEPSQQSDICYGV